MLKKELDKDRLAVIDLGSNTFHLLIVEKQTTPPFFKVVYRKREFVYILGANSKNFGTDEQKRAIDCISSFREILDNHNVKTIVPVATAAFRMANNGDAFIAKLEFVLQSQINIFSGQKEAEFIFKGVKLMPNAFENTNLIMDIGGGSVEFILFKKDKIILSESFNTGISFLRHNFKMSEPIACSEKILLNDYLEKQHINFFDQLKFYKPSQLIGSSGPFEILEHLTSVSPIVYGNKFSRKTVLNYSHQISNSSKKERIDIQLMPANRADLSKESFLLLEHTLKSIECIEKVCVSPFSLKEGIIAHYLNLE
jgi:exopolyphosphatase/guanosine-5'-triphosphate,3'-diphosphate pyrophosphatase